MNEPDEAFSMAKDVCRALNELGRSHSKWVGFLCSKSHVKFHFRILLGRNLFDERRIKKNAEVNSNIYFSLRTSRFGFFRLERSVIQIHSDYLNALCESNKKIYTK